MNVLYLSEEEIQLLIKWYEVKEELFFVESQDINLSTKLENKLNRIKELKEIKRELVK